MATVPPEPIELLRRSADAVTEALDANADWSHTAAAHPGQYAHDVVADQAALAVLTGAGVRVLSEESGLSGSGDLVVVVDPVDGSTNASLGIPHWCVSLCAVSADGPVAALVRNPANGESFEAVRGEGATLDGRSISPRSPADLAASVVGLSGHPPRGRGGWSQFRVLGAAALDLCYVACGRLDAYAGLYGGLRVWDVAGGAFVCREAGAVVGDVDGLDPWPIDADARRRVVAAGSTAVFEELRDVVSAR